MLHWVAPPIILILSILTVIMYVTILKDPIASGGLCSLDTLLQRFTTVFSTSPHKILDPPMYTKGFYFDISLMLMIINIVGTYVRICSFQYVTSYCSLYDFIIRSVYT